MPNYKEVRENYYHGLSNTQSKLNTLLSTLIDDPHLMDEIECAEIIQECRHILEDLHRDMNATSFELLKTPVHFKEKFRNLTRELDSTIIKLRTLNLSNVKKWGNLEKFGDYLRRYPEVASLFAEKQIELLLSGDFEYRNNRLQLSESNLVEHVSKSETEGYEILSDDDEEKTQKDKKSVKIGTINLGKNASKGYLLGELDKISNQVERQRTERSLLDKAKSGLIVAWGGLNTVWSVIPL